jgi:hypothetical protein
MRTDGRTNTYEEAHVHCFNFTNSRNSVQRTHLNWGRDIRLLHFHVLRNAAGTRGLDPKCVLPFYTVAQCLEHLSVFDVPVQTHLAFFHP